MLIAIDYDDTITADVELWCNFLKDLYSRGHGAICVTARKMSEENRKEITDTLAQYGASVTEILFCNEDLKLETLRKCGINPQIWIDNDPYAIVPGF